MTCKDKKKKEKMKGTKKEILDSPCSVIVSSEDTFHFHWVLLSENYFVLRLLLLKIFTPRKTNHPKALKMHQKYIYLISRRAILCHDLLIAWCTSDAW